MALRLVTDHGEDQIAAVAAVAAVAPTAAVAAVAPSPPSLSAVEVTALVGLFQGMLSGTENRILAAMADNSRMAGERWAKHDAELAANTVRVTNRFAQIDSQLQTTATALQAYLDREHDDDVRMDARIRPLRGSFGWLWANRKDIALLGIGILALANILLDGVLGGRLG